MADRDHADRHTGQQGANDAAMAQRNGRDACEPGLRRRLRKWPDVIGALPALPSALVSRAAAAGRLSAAPSQLGRQTCRDRHRAALDALAPAALLRRRHHQARVGAVALQVADVEPGDLRRTRAGRRGDLGPEPEPRRDRIGGGNDLAHVALGQSDVARGVRVRQARQCAAPHRGVADARIVRGGQVERGLERLAVRLTDDALRPSSRPSRQCRSSRKVSSPTGRASSVEGISLRTTAALATRPPRVARSRSYASSASVTVAGRSPGILAANEDAGFVLRLPECADGRAVGGLVIVGERDGVGPVRAVTIGGA